MPARQNHSHQYQRECNPQQCQSIGNFEGEEEIFDSLGESFGFNSHASASLPDVLSAHGGNISPSPIIKTTYMRLDEYGWNPRQFALGRFHEGSLLALSGGNVDCGSIR